jgi:ribonuclease Z
MTPLLHAYLVNDRFGDPALYVEFKFEKRALLFDLGDLHPLAPRKVLRLSDIFVSHRHIDHFIGFDQILRVLLGRDREVRLYGPEGIIEAVDHRLRSYSWNLAERYQTDLSFEVTEVRSPSEARSALFRLRNGFAREDSGKRSLRDGVLLDQATFRVRTAVLDHGIPCLAFAVEEKAHVNVWKTRLRELDLPVGPWLRELKQAVVRGDPEDAPFRVCWRRAGGVTERHFRLGELKRRVLKVVAGQKITYVVDVVFSDQNARRITRLARGSDILFIEAAFAAEDSGRAAERRHLTTAQAGHLARLAGARRVEPFHFSPRYAEQEARLVREVEAALEAEPGPTPAATGPGLGPDRPMS